MPSKPKRICSHSGCPELVDSGYCDKHKKQTRSQYDDRRGTAAQRGYGSRWQKARKVYLAKHPLCRHCEQEGKVVPATVVDHIKPHKGNKRLFWDSSNWQSLCKRHHDIKTANEDGGFGN